MNILVKNELGTNLNNQIIKKNYRQIKAHFSKFGKNQKPSD